ncbi:MAG: type II secretion system protein GspF, partial [Pseudomonas sp.]|nr:type II secretion system protein GspF [Pseudomonas sp.]
MAHFKYRALDSEGATQHGSLEANDQNAAVALLQKRGWLLLDISVISGPSLRQALNRGA